MRHKWHRTRWLGTLLLGLASCQAAQPDLKPAPQKGELRVPPSDDTRYSSPTKYPKDTLNQDLLKRPDAPGGTVDPRGMRAPGAGGVGH
jgi:hypothetical protein